MSLMNMNRFDWHQSGVTLSAFLLPALSLAMPSGYSWGALLLCVVGLSAKVHAPSTVKYTPSNTPFVVASLTIGLIFATDSVTASGWDWRGMDRATKFMLVPVAAWALWERATDETFLKWGIWLGTMGSGLTAAWQVVVSTQGRADGHTHAIHFGGLSLLMAVWSLIWATQSKGKEKWVGHLAGTVGVLACLLSQSRGAWVMAPIFFAMWFLWSRQFKATTPARRWPLLAFAGVVVLLAAAQWPMLKDRYVAAVQEVSAYTHGQDPNQVSMTSVGQRLAHWQFALKMGSEKPWLGWGDDGYKREKQRRVAAGEAPVGIEGFGHAHNDWMEMWGKHGSVGIAALMLVLLAPAHIYWRVLQKPLTNTPFATQSVQRSFSLCGLVCVVGYFGFGQTQVMFAHNSGTMMYLFMNLLFLAGCKAHSGPCMPKAH